MAVDIDGHGQARDMGGALFDVHCQSSGSAAEALGADTQRIDLFQQFLRQLASLKRCPQLLCLGSVGKEMVFFVK